MVEETIIRLGYIAIRYCIAEFNLLELKAFPVASCRSKMLGFRGLFWMAGMLLLLLLITDPVHRPSYLSLATSTSIPGGVRCDSQRDKHCDLAAPGWPLVETARAVVSSARAKERRGTQRERF